MTQYRVPVDQELLDQRDRWPVIPGFRLISIDGPWPRHPDTIICTFEDDHAPRNLAGKLIEPTVRTGEYGLRIAGLTEIPYPGPLPAPSEHPV